MPKVGLAGPSVKALARFLSDLTKEVIPAKFEDNTRWLTQKECLEIDRLVGEVYRAKGRKIRTIDRIAVPYRHVRNRHKATGLDLFIDAIYGRLLSCDKSPASRLFHFLKERRELKAGEKQFLREILQSLLTLRPLRFEASKWEDALRILPALCSKDYLAATQKPADLNKVYYDKSREYFGRVFAWGAYTDLFLNQKAWIDKYLDPIAPSILFISQLEDKDQSAYLKSNYPEHTRKYPVLSFTELFHEAVKKDSQNERQKKHRTKSQRGDEATRKATSDFASDIYRTLAGEL